VSVLVVRDELVVLFDQQSNMLSIRELRRLGLRCRRDGKHFLDGGRDVLDGLGAAEGQPHEIPGQHTQQKIGKGSRVE
jgi:hypothetical protein